MNITLQIKKVSLETDQNGKAYYKEGIFYVNMKEVINSESDIEILFRELYMKVFKVNENDETTGETDSGWVIDKYLGFCVAITRYVVRTARGYIELPEKYRIPKKGLISIRNEDDKCIQYCIIAALHPAKNNKTRIDYYQSKKVQENIVPLYN